jgi:lysophospholipase L1-like esterase
VQIPLACAATSGGAAGLDACADAVHRRRLDRGPRSARAIPCRDGQVVLQPFFDPDKLRVVNAAQSGRSSRTFITEGHWDRLLAEMKPGDFVVIQFGHNDSKPYQGEAAGQALARGSMPGIGDQSQQIEKLVDGKPETVHTFGWYLRKMISETRSRGATPLLFSTTKTNAWSGRGILCQSQTYRLVDVPGSASSEHVPFVDLMRITADRYQRLGETAVANQFVDKMHTNEAGAEANAADVCQACDRSKELPFDAMLSEPGRRIAPDPGPVDGSRCAELSPSATP